MLKNMISLYGNFETFERVIQLMRENRTLKRLQPPGGVWGGVVPFPCVALLLLLPCVRARARTARVRGLTVGVGVDGCPET